MNKLIILVVVGLTLAISAQAVPRNNWNVDKQNAKNTYNKSFPKTINLPTSIPNGFRPEGFTIGRGTDAYAGSISGAIYKADLRTGQGKMLVEPIDSGENAVLTLGMRVDVRTNYLFVAGGLAGNALVYDGDSGKLLATYQLAPTGTDSLINDLTITRDAVYFTDSLRPYFYRLPLARNGGLPSDPTDVVEVALIGEFENSGFPFCCESNGIVASRNGKVLIIGNSNTQRMYRVDPTTGYAERILPDVTEFPDGMVMHGKKLYILHPSFGGLLAADQVTVMKLSRDFRQGTIVGTITDPTLDGIASGARFGNSLYVINAKYFDFPTTETVYFITKLKLNDID